MTEKCDIIIPSKNAPWWLTLCLEELFRNAEPEELGKVMVVDDGSSPDAFGTIERICARHPAVKLMKNTGHPGFGGACNFGVKHSSAKFLLFLNTDCLITRGTVRKMVKAAMADPSIGLASPLSNNSPCLTLSLLPGRSYIEMNELLEETAKGMSQKEVVLEACTIVGNCLLITRKCWDKTGEFAKIWGQGYGEESDYQMRATDHGFRGVALTDTYVYHFGNGTFRYEATANELRKRNHALFMKTWGEDFKLHARMKDHDPVVEAVRRLAAMPHKLLRPQVLFLLPGLTQGIGGVHAVIDICNHLLRHGVDAKFAVLGVFDNEKMGNFQEPVFAGFLNYPDELSFIKQNQVAPECVVGTFYTTMLPCFVYAAVNSAHAAYFVQGYECLFSNGIHYNPVIDTYPMADQIMVTSKWLKSRVVSHAPKCEPVVLPIGIDRDLFTPRGVKTAGKKVRVGLVLRDASDKGQWILLDLFRELALHQDLLEFTVLAAPQYAEPPNFEKESLRWLKLPLDRAVIATELGACDIFVDASLHEGFGLLPLEAMACGATVVVSDSGGVNQYLRHNANGLIVPELNHPEKYAEAILSLARDRERLARFQAEALATAAEYGAPEKYAGYEKFFKEMLAGPVKKRDAAWVAAAGVFSAKSGVISEARVSRMTESLAAQDYSIAVLTAERNRIANGLSFKIGRILTAPLRMLLGRKYNEYIPLPLPERQACPACGFGAHEHK